jgi:hypothetical protein
MKILVSLPNEEIISLSFTEGKWLLTTTHTVYVLEDGDWVNIPRVGEEAPK